VGKPAVTGTATESFLHREPVRPDRPLTAPRGIDVTAAVCWRSVRLTIPRARRHGRAHEDDDRVRVGQGEPLSREHARPPHRPIVHAIVGGLRRRGVDVTGSFASARCGAVSG
jgi:hypothetical protein